MKRDKKFYINSIKMDLFRIVTAAGDTNKKLPTQSIKEFLNHASSEFQKIKLSKRESFLQSKLQNLNKQLHNLNNQTARLHWAEDILTIRCRL